MIKKWMIIIMVVIALCIGCGESEMATESVREEDVQIAEENSAEENEQVAEESPAEENTQIVTESSEKESPTTVVQNIDEFAQYMVTLSPTEPAIVIYNEGSGEVYNIQEGQVYHLKSDDRIFQRCSEQVCRWSQNGVLSYDMSLDSKSVCCVDGHFANGAGGEYKEAEFVGWEIMPDYTKQPANEEIETKYVIYLDEEGTEKKLLTVYFVIP
jgi:hypothetical protein